MRSLISLLSVALLAHLVATQVTDKNGKPVNLDKCLLSPDTARKLDYTNVKRSCAANVTLDARCEGCICAFGELFTPLLQEAGLNVSLTQVDQATATRALLACSDTILPVFQEKGLDLESLGQLASCTKLPTCLNTSSPAPPNSKPPASDSKSPNPANSTSRS